MFIQEIQDDLSIIIDACKEPVKRAKIVSFWEQVEVCTATHRESLYQECSLKVFEDAMEAIWEFSNEDGLTEEVDQVCQEFTSAMIFNWNPSLWTVEKFINKINHSFENDGPMSNSLIALAISEFEMIMVSDPSPMIVLLAPLLFEYAAALLRKTVVSPTLYTMERQMNSMIRHAFLNMGKSLSVQEVDSLREAIGSFSSS